MKKQCPFMLPFFLLLLWMGCELDQQHGKQSRQQPAGQQVPPSAADSPSSGLAEDVEFPAGGEVSLTRNLYFIVDGSGSMQGNKIVEAKQAFAEFIGKLPGDINCGLLAFDATRHRNKERVALGPDNRQACLDAVNALNAGGGTPLARAMMAGAGALNRQWETQLGYGEYRLIILTDGEADSLAQAVRFVNNQHAPIGIYTIGFHLSRDHELRKYSSFYANADDKVELVGALEQTAAESESFDPALFEF